MREDAHDARRTLSFARVNRLDSALRHRAQHDETASEVWRTELSRVLRAASHLRNAVHATHLFSDVSLHIVPPRLTKPQMSFAARISARTTARFLSSTL